MPERKRIPRLKDWNDVLSQAGKLLFNMGMKVMQGELVTPEESAKMIKLSGYIDRYIGEAKEEVQE